MLHHLLESGGRPAAGRARGRAGTAASAVVHAAVIAAAAVATARGAPRPHEPADAPDLVFRTAAPAPRPAATAPAGSASTPTRPRPAEPAPAPAPALPVVTALELPPAALAVGVSAPVSDPGEFAPRGLAPGGGAPGGVGGGPPGDGGALAEALVDEPVVPDPRNPPPRYPEALRAAGLGGRVTVRFVVDTAGRVEAGSVAFAAPGDPRLEGAVREALARARFRPARAGGRPVRQLAERPYVFAPAAP
jgi:protein TonB